MASGFKPLDHDQWKKAVRRVLNIGPPNSRKTSALKTWPRPMHVIVAPGEKGSASIELEDGVKAWVWEQDSDVDAAVVWASVQKLTREIISGAHGPCTTLAVDGLHKLYGYIYEMKLAGLVDAFPGSDQDKLGGRAYGLAHKEFLNYLTLVNQSNVPYAVFTCWSAKEKDNPEAKKSAVHIWPDLPGQVAQWVLGEFSVVLYSEVGTAMPDGTAPSQWQLRPMGIVAGVGVKAPLAIAKLIPATCPQDWRVLERILLGLPQDTVISPPPSPTTTTT